MKVFLFIPCLVDEFYPNVGISMVKVLERLGVEVHYPEGQTCCGQPAFNTGYWPEARELAERFLTIFQKAEYVIGCSGSCTAMVRMFYPELFHHHRRYVEAKSLAGRTFEFTEFLVNKLNVTNVGAIFPHKVTYHDACHLLRELKVKNQPRELLKQVKGLELIEMKDSETCCGFGGTFAVKFEKISSAMDEVKCQSIADTGAEYVVANDSSCLMHIHGMLTKKKIPARGIHIAEILAST